MSQFFHVRGFILLAVWLWSVFAPFYGSDEVLGFSPPGCRDIPFDIVNVHPFTTQGNFLKGLDNFSLITFYRKLKRLLYRCHILERAKRLEVQLTFESLEQNSLFADPDNRAGTYTIFVRAKIQECACGEAEQQTREEDPADPFPDKREHIVKGGCE